MLSRYGVAIKIGAICFLLPIFLVVLLSSGIAREVGYDGLVNRNYQWHYQFRPYLPWHKCTTRLDAAGGIGE